MNKIPSPPFPVGPPVATQGLLIDLLCHAEMVCSNNLALSTNDVLAAWFHELYPDATNITCPGRFEATVRRMAAPTRSSSHGSGRLEGKKLECYRWVPKNTAPKTPGKLILKIELNITSIGGVINNMVVQC